jgi:very-short-patch-repair endonuclease
MGYVVDFACLERRLAIEIDGEAHSIGDNPRRDRIRDGVLAEAGFKTLRIAARDVLDNLEGVLTLILTTCGYRPLHHDAARRGPPPRSGED